MVAKALCLQDYLTRLVEKRNEIVPSLSSLSRVVNFDLHGIEEGEESFGSTSDETLDESRALQHSPVTTVVYCGVYSGKIRGTGETTIEWGRGLEWGGVPRLQSEFLAVEVPRVDDYSVSGVE